MTVEGEVNRGPSFVFRLDIAIPPTHCPPLNSFCVNL